MAALFVQWSDSIGETRQVIHSGNDGSVKLHALALFAGHDRRCLRIRS